MSLNVGEKIKKLITDKGLTQDEPAEIMTAPRMSSREKYFRASRKSR